MPINSPLSYAGAELSQSEAVQGDTPLAGDPLCTQERVLIVLFFHPGSWWQRELLKVNLVNGSVVTHS